MTGIFKVLSILTSIFLLVVAFVIAAFAFPVFGNQALIVRSGSMEPAINVGAVIIVRPESGAVHNSKYNVGEIIAFRVNENPNKIITHRVTSIEKNSDGIFYHTKGDANETEDNWSVNQKDIIGKSHIMIPNVGKILAFTRSNYGFPLLVILPATLVIIVEIINIIRELRKRIKEEHKKLGHDTDPSVYFSTLGFQKLAETKPKFTVLKMVAPILLMGFFLQSTFALFSDTETSTGNVLKAADVFPTIEVSPTPTPIVSVTPTITPTPTSSQNLCDDINVDISGNGAGSVNGVFIICINNVVVSQSTSTTVNTNIDSSANSGGNTGNGTTGNASSNVNVQVQGGNNTVTTASPTPTPVVNEP